MKIERHRTAMSRRTVSRPVGLAMADEILCNQSTFFDYGCGRGFDVQFLLDAGISATGWDPAFAPSMPKTYADVVNIGYVVNVIEDPTERVDALKSAWSLARHVLVVAGRLTVESHQNDFVPFSDGEITNRGTFQKFYEQHELRDWIGTTLSAEPVAAAPGIFYVFRDEVARETFVASRFRPTRATPRVRISDQLYDEHRELLDQVANFFSERGRLPADNEVPYSLEVKEAFGGWRKAFRVLLTVTGQDQWSELASARADDLTVYIALSKFGRRSTWSKLDPSLRQDVRVHFGSYKRACEVGDELLFSAGSLENIDQAIKRAPVGKRTPNALYIHRSALGTLPPILRVYEGCGRVLVGEVQDANIVKLSRNQPKVSFLSYPEFDTEPHPALLRTVVTYPGELRVFYREYQSTSNRPILHRKEEFVAAEYPLRAKFQRLTQQEERFGLFSHPETIGFEKGWSDALEEWGVTLRGHRVIRNRPSDHDQ
ncbi:MAG: DNA phosphorothioation-associated putative methyltransferase [Acidimicrobiales bacterium]